jgi:uncharacterized RmlC-like cupin family protein
MTNLQTVSYVQPGKTLLHHGTILMFHADFTDIAILYVNTVKHKTTNQCSQNVKMVKYAKEFLTKYEGKPLRT